MCIVQIQLAVVGLIVDDFYGFVPVVVALRDVVHEVAVVGQENSRLEEQEQF